MHLGEIVAKSEEGDDDETMQKSYASLGSCEVRAPGAWMLALQQSIWGSWVAPLGAAVENLQHGIRYAQAAGRSMTWGPYIQWGTKKNANFYRDTRKLAHFINRNINTYIRK